MKLSPARFNAHLANMGQAFAWQKAYDCPCRDEHSGAALANCPQCHGKGMVYADAVTGTAGVSGQKVQREWAQFGLWESGDVVVSIGSDSALYGIGEFDRVSMIDSSAPFSVVLRRTGSEKLPFNAISIDRVFWLTSSSVVDGGIPSANEDRTLAFIANPPPDGQSYSITGRRIPEYFCFGEFPSDRAHHHGLALPRRVVLRRFDLMQR